MTATATATRRTANVPDVGVVRTPRHLYYFDGRGPWPGVTTVTDVLDKPALTKWHREQVAQAAIRHADRLVADREAGNVDAAIAFLLATRNEGTDGRERGTRIHATLESIVKREPFVIDARDASAIDGARGWLNTHHVRPLEVEAFLLNESAGYGGTCDLIAEVDGETWLLDWKTGKSVAWPNGQIYDEMRYQLAAYSRAEFIGKVGDSTQYPIPPITRFGILHVTEGGTRLYPADVTDADWLTFLACLYIHGQRAKRS